MALIPKQFMQYSVKKTKIKQPPLLCVPYCAYSLRTVLRKHFINENKWTQRHENDQSFLLFFSTKRSTHQHTLMWVLRGNDRHVARSHKPNVSIFVKYPSPLPPPNPPISANKDKMRHPFGGNCPSRPIISVGPLYISIVYPRGLVTFESVIIISFPLSLCVSWLLPHTWSQSSWRL